jgi:L-amino acid ligase C-terminal domain 2
MWTHSTLQAGTLVRVYMRLTKTGDTPLRAASVDNDGEAVAGTVIITGFFLPVVSAADRLLPARSDIIAVESFVSPGDTTQEMRSSWDRTAMAMAWASTHEDALESAKTAISKIRIRVRPVE